ncbi:MAG: hypothetical protein WAT66_08360 [Actinomycetota bacterium]
MKRRSIIAGLALCAALLLAPNAGRAFAPAQGVEMDGVYVVYTCVDATPHVGPGCPGDKRVFVANKWVGPKPPPAK